MNKNNRRAAARVAVAIGCLVFGCGTATWAQTGAGDGVTGAQQAPVTLPPASDGAAPKNEAGATQIEEVVVTATKREQSVRDIPESISVFTGTQLEDKGKLNLTDFIEESPGVTASDGGPGFTRVTMRGIDTDTDPYTGMPPTVGFFIGDTAFTDTYTNNIIPDLSAFDLQSVEVLKGPQGTLFGGAALAGAVRYVLQEPVLGDWEARGFSQFVGASGGGDALTSGAAVNIPLYKNQLAARVDYVRRNYPGTITDERTGLRDQDYGGGNQVRAIVLWQPVHDFRLKITHLTQDFYAANELNLSSYPNLRGNINTTYPTPSTNNFRLDDAEAGYNFYGMKLTVLASSLQKNAVFLGDDTVGLIGTPPKDYPATAELRTSVTDYSKALSQEVRLQSNGEGPFKWLVGLYNYNLSNYFNLLGDTPLDQSLTGPGSLLGTNPALLTLLQLAGLPASSLSQTTSFLDGTSNSKSLEHALFMNFDYTLWHRLDLSAGVRLYEASVGGGYVGSGILVMAENHLMDSNTESSIRQKGVNPKFSATYHFTRDISLYATAAKGFRFGGVNDFPSTPSNGIPATYKSDSLWNYEVGLRTSWLNNTLHADITPYYIDYKDPIIGQNTPGAISIGYSDNVGGATSKGIESSIVWKTPLRGLSLLLNGSVGDSHTTKAFKDTNNVEIEPGQEMPGANHLQYTASGSYLLPLWWGIKVAADTGYTFVGKGYNDINHDVVINGFGNLHAGLLFESTAYSFLPKLAINASNLLNVTVPTAAAIGMALVNKAPYGQYALNPPREISARLSLDF